MLRMRAMDDDLRWENACLAFLASTPPTLKPLADLLRTDEPIPQGIRDILAQMIDPDADAYLHFKLRLDSTETKRSNLFRDLEAMKVAADFSERPGSREAAAEETGEAFGTSARNVFRFKERTNALLNWLRGGK